MAGGAIHVAERLRSGCAILGRIQGRKDGEVQILIIINQVGGVYTALRERWHLSLEIKKRPAAASSALVEAVAGFAPVLANLR